MTNAVARLFYGNVEERMTQGFELVSEEQRQMSDLILGMKDYLAEVHGYVQRLESQVQSLQSTVTDIAEHTADTLTLVTENKAKHFIGKQPEFLEESEQLASKKSAIEKRSTLRKAVQVLSKGRGMQQAWQVFYARIQAITGKDLRDYGKKSLGKAEGYPEFEKFAPTYIDTIFFLGIEDKVVVLAEDIISGVDAN